MVRSFVGTSIQLGLLFQAGVVMTPWKLASSSSQHLRAGHEGGLLGRQVGCEILVELGGVQVIETVGGLFDRGGFAEVAGEAFSVIGLVLPGIRHVRGDIHQAGHRWIRPGFGGYGSAVAVCD